MEDQKKTNETGQGSLPLPIDIIKLDTIPELTTATEGLNNKSCETNVCLCECLTADVGETYMSRKRTNIGVITGSGKERSTKKCQSYWNRYYPTIT